jgi:outer membrane beta-barrel protein
MTLNLSLLIALAIALATPWASAKEPSKSSSKKTPPAPSTAGDEAAELDKIKQRYWAQGSESEMGVVQNRLYTKSHKTEVWLFGGLLASDPFLTTRSYGLSLGHHFNETLSVHAFYMGHSSSPSAALTTLRQGGKEANTNLPLSSTGAEVKASLLYGKLSLMGTKILYYDMHVGLGAAVTWTETGKYLGPMASIGQSIYLAKFMALRFDYRLMAYREGLVEREITSKLGQVVGHRNNFSNVFQLGLTFMLGGDSR